MAASRQRTISESELLNQAERVETILCTLSENSMDIPERRYKGHEIETRIKMELSRIYVDEKRNRFDFEMDRDEKNRRLGYTLSQLNKIQEFYKVSPGRKPDDPPVVLSFTNFKGGCWKSTTSHHAASYYAGLGYKILLVDLDPQATLTTNFGYLPDLDIMKEETLYPYIVESPGYTEDNINKVIKKTNITNIDLIPSSLDLDESNGWFYVEVYKAQQKKSSADLIWLYSRIRTIIDAISDPYDIVILDGTPSLGHLAMNIILAADNVVVPVPTETPDLASTGRFCRKLSDKFGEIAELIGNDNAENMFPGRYFMPTRYTSGNQITMGSQEVLRCINDSFLDDSLKNFVRKHDSVISNLGLLRRTVFDVNPGIMKTDAGEVNIRKESREKALGNFSDVFDEILDRCVFPLWPSKQV